MTVPLLVIDPVDEGDVPIGREQLLPIDTPLSAEGFEILTRLSVALLQDRVVEVFSSNVMVPEFAVNTPPEIVKLLPRYITAEGAVNVPRDSENAPAISTLPPPAARVPPL